MSEFLRHFCKLTASALEPAVVRKRFDLLVEGIVCGEISLLDGVLAVGSSRDRAHHLAQIAACHVNDFYRHLHPGR